MINLNLLYEAKKKKKEDNDNNEVTSEISSLFCFFVLSSLYFIQHKLKSFITN